MRAPITDGEPPNRRRHNASLRTATGATPAAASASAGNALPIAGLMRMTRQYGVETNSAFAGSDCSPVSARTEGVKLATPVNERALSSSLKRRPGPPFRRRGGVASLPGDVKDHETAGAGERRRTKERRVDDAEDGGRCGDADRHREHRRGGEDRRAGEAPTGEACVAKNGGDHSGRTRIVPLNVRTLTCASPLPRLKRMVRGGEAIGRTRVNPFSIDAADTRQREAPADADEESARSTAPL